MNKCYFCGKDCEGIDCDDCFKAHYKVIDKKRSNWLYYNDWCWGYIKPKWTYFALYPVWLLLKPFIRKLRSWIPSLDNRWWKWPLSWLRGWNKKMFHVKLQRIK